MALHRDLLYGMRAADGEGKPVNHAATTNRSMAELSGRSVLCLVPLETPALARPISSFHAEATPLNSAPDLVGTKGACSLTGFVAAVLLCLLTACASSLSELRQEPPSQIGEFHMAAGTLSYCVHQALKETESTESPYTYRLHAAPRQNEFFIAATGISDALARRLVVGLELHFIGHDQTTRVEMREGAIDGAWLGRRAWPLIARCSQRVTAPVRGVE